MPESPRRACKGRKICQPETDNPKAQACREVGTLCFAHSAVSCQSQKHLSTAQASRGLIITRRLSNASL